MRLLLLALCLLLPLSAAESLRVLMIGNSYTAQTRDGVKGFLEAEPEVEIELRRENRSHPERRKQESAAHREFLQLQRDARLPQEPCLLHGALISKPLWIHKFDQRVEEASLCIYRDKVIVLAGDGYVHALK